MPARRGTTEKVSISLERDVLRALRKRAKRLHDGNLSAVIAELAEDAKLLEGMHELVEFLGGPSLTEEVDAQLEREWSREGAAPRASRRKARSR